MKKLSFILFRRLEYVFLFIFLALIISSGCGRRTNYAANIGNATSLQAAHFVVKYDDSEEVLEVKSVANMDEVALYGPYSPVSFTGQMTGYGPDCVGCSGKVACPPRQDVRNNNIYYEDANYGSVRILAADKKIPCGSMIKIQNLTFSSEPVYGIVLDRGGVIKGNIIDFLVASEADSDAVGRQRDVYFEIIRWGW